METTGMGTTSVHSNYRSMPVRSYKAFLPFCFLEVTPLSTVLLGPWFALWEAISRSLSSITTSEVGIEECASLGLPDYLLPVSNSSQRSCPDRVCEAENSGCIFPGFCALPRPLSSPNGYYLQAIWDNKFGWKGNTLNPILAAGLALIVWQRIHNLQKLEKGSGP